MNGRKNKCNMEAEIERYVLAVILPVLLKRWSCAWKSISSNAKQRLNRVSPIMHIYIAWMSAFKVQPACLPFLLSPCNFFLYFGFCLELHAVIAQEFFPLLLFRIPALERTSGWIVWGCTRWADTKEEKNEIKPKQKCLKHRKHLMIMQNDCIFRRRADCNRHRWACYAFPFRHTEWMNESQARDTKKRTKKEFRFRKGRWLSVLMEKLTHTQKRIPSITNAK